MEDAELTMRALCNCDKLLALGGAGEIVGKRTGETRAAILFGADLGEALLASELRILSPVILTNGAAKSVSKSLASNRAQEYNADVHGNGCGIAHPWRESCRCSELNKTKRYFTSQSTATDA